MDTSFYITCVSTPFTPGGTNADVVTIKYNASNGQFGWTPTAEARFNGSFNGDDKPADIDTCMWASGGFQYHVWVGGYTTQSTTGKDMLAVCYRDNGTTFSQLVSIARDGDGLSDDRATSIDAAPGNLIDGSRAFLTGWRTLGGVTDFMTGKCNSQLDLFMMPGWPFYYSPALANEAAGVAAVDEGHCFVTGAAIEAPAGTQCRTIRYDDGTP